MKYLKRLVCRFFGHDMHPVGEVKIGGDIAMLPVCQRCGYFVEGSGYEIPGLALESTPRGYDYFKDEFDVRQEFWSAKRGKP